MKFTGAVCFYISFGIAGAAVAADPFYVGSWTLTTAVVAPWADPQRAPDSAEQARLLGKTVVLKAREISGPPPFACARPQYKIQDDGLWSRHDLPGRIRRDAARQQEGEPKALAASLGFTRAQIRTLETGCEIDVHFVNDTTAEVGLDDYVYT